MRQGSFCPLIGYNPAMRPCLNCLRPIGEIPSGVPAICSECWPTLTLLEKDRLIASEDLRVHMRAILAMMQGNRETEEITRAADLIQKNVRNQTATLAGIRADLVQFLEWFKARLESGEDDDDDDEWRRSLRENEDAPE